MYALMPLLKAEIQEPKQSLRHLRKVSNNCDIGTRKQTNHLQQNAEIQHKRDH